MIPITDVIILMVLALLIFGPRRLPEIGRMVGKGLAEFRRASNELRRSINAELALEEDDAAARGRSAEMNRPTLLPTPPPPPPAAIGHGAEAVPPAPPASLGAAELPDEPPPIRPDPPYLSTETPVFGDAHPTPSPNVHELPPAPVPSVGETSSEPHPGLHERHAAPHPSVQEVPPPPHPSPHEMPPLPPPSVVEVPPPPDSLLHSHGLSPGAGTLTDVGAMPDVGAGPDFGGGGPE
jgi:sec-independent protein translocase protein TatB